MAPENYEYSSYISSIYLLIFIGYLQMYDLMNVRVIDSDILNQIQNDKTEKVPHGSEAGAGTVRLSGAEIALFLLFCSLFHFG